jgi:hypothetical protein
MAKASSSKVVYKAQREKEREIYKARDQSRILVTTNSM